MSRPHNRAKIKAATIGQVVHATTTKVKTSKPKEEKKTENLGTSTQFDNQGNTTIVGGERVRVLTLPKYQDPKTAKQLHLENLARQGIKGKKIHETAFFTNPFIAGGKKKIVDQETIGPGSVYEHFDKDGKPIMHRRKFVAFDKKGKKTTGSAVIQDISVQEKETSRYWKRRNKEKKNSFARVNETQTGLAMAKKQAFRDFVSKEVANKNQEFHLRLMKSGQYQGYEGQKIDTKDADSISFHYNETHPTTVGIGEKGSFHPVLGVATFFAHKPGHNVNYYKRQAKEFNAPVATGIKAGQKASKAAEAISIGSGLSYSTGLPLDIQMGIGAKKTESVVQARDRVVANHKAMADKAKKYEQKFETANQGYFEAEAAVRTTHHTLDELRTFAAAKLSKTSGTKVKAEDITDSQLHEYIKAANGEKQIYNSSYTDSDYQLVAKLAASERDKTVTKTVRKNSKDTWHPGVTVGKKKHINPPRTWEVQAQKTISLDNGPEYSLLTSNNLMGNLTLNNRKKTNVKIKRAIGKKPIQFINKTINVTTAEQLKGGSIHSPITGTEHIDKKLLVAISTGDFHTSDFNTPSVPIKRTGKKVKAKKAESIGSLNSFTTVFASDIYHNVRGTAGAAVRAQMAKKDKKK